MVFIKHEEVTLPVRFLLLTMHFVITLTVALDLSYLTTNMNGADTDNYSSQKNMLSGFAYAALGCFGVEFVTFFTGVSIFIRPLTLVNMFAHLTGMILVACFYYQNWSLNAYIAFAVTFSFAPLVTELLTLLYLTMFAYASY